MTAPPRRRAASPTFRKRKKRTFSLRQRSISCMERRSRQARSWKMLQLQPRLTQQKCQIRLSHSASRLYKGLMSQDMGLFIWPESTELNDEIASDCCRAVFLDL